MKVPLYSVEPNHTFTSLSDNLKTPETETFYLKDLEQCLLNIQLHIIAQPACSTTLQAQNVEKANMQIISRARVGEICMI